MRNFRGLGATVCSAAMLFAAACSETSPASEPSPDSAANEIAPVPVLPVPDVFVEHADYSNGALWLCKPGLADDKCKVDLDATVIAANGSMSAEKFQAAANPEIDCFFVYPTVSLDPGFLSDWSPDKMEFDDVALQFARLGAACRTYAPLYRQFTLTALRAASGGAAPEGERPPAGVGGYQDVVDAWNHYMTHDNNGRGVVIMGHSQGAGLVARLIAQEVEGKPSEEQFISGIVLGSAVMVPEGADTGGTYKSIPLCRTEDQTGCVISYASFRDTNPPPATSRFGRSQNGMRAACNNPASLAGGKATPDSYFLTQGFLNGSGGETPPWTNPAQEIATKFVKTPGLVSTECVSNGDFTYLQVSVNPDPADPRTDVLAGEVQRATGPDLAWGLHLIDVDVSMGDLVRIVKKQAAAHAAGK